MTRFLPDTSCIVAAVCGWHEHHERVAREIERRLGSGEGLVVAAPALVEAYAVLTRLPPPHRLSPADSRSLLEASFLSNAVDTVALRVEEYVRLLHGAPDRGIAGGRTYDAVIVACGVAARADVILTFDERHLGLLAGQGMQVLIPA